MAMDANGDGKEDLLARYADGTSKIYEPNLSGTNNLFTIDLDVASVFQSEDAVFPLWRSQVLLADFDGDGLTDVLGRVPQAVLAAYDAGNLADVAYMAQLCVGSACHVRTWAYRLQVSPGQFGPLTRTPQGLYENDNDEYPFFWLAEIDGDAGAEILYQKVQGGTLKVVDLHSPDQEDGPFQSSVPWVKEIESHGGKLKVEYGAAVVDVNGDGISEFLVEGEEPWLFSHGGGTFDKDTYLDIPAAAEMFSVNFPVNTFTNSQPFDYNGDGLVDLLQLLNDNSVESGYNELRLLTADGNGFPQGGAQVLAQSGVGVSFYPVPAREVSPTSVFWQVGDFNGDSLDDMVYYARPDVFAPESEMEMVWLFSKGPAPRSSRPCPRWGSAQTDISYAPLLHDTGPNAVYTADDVVAAGAAPTGRSVHGTSSGKHSPIVY